VQVKAQGILNAAKYIEERYGQRALSDIVRACSPAVRETYVSSIAINWHPVEELIEMVDTAEKQLGRGGLKLAQDIGAAGARANMKGMLLRIAFYWGKPEFLMRRAAGLWRQFNDEGEMELIDMDKHHVRVEVRGIREPNATFCAIIHGWIYETAQALGITNATAHHTECRARGNARCMYEVRGGVEASLMKQGKGPPSTE
jgi:predicted hydrocarbon binding protein